MGIKNLYKFIEKYCPKAITITNIKKYQNKIIAIDTNLLIYKIVYAIRKNGYDIKNNDKIITHIHGLLLKFKSFKKYNITPVFVFDGKQPEIKYKELDKRKKIWLKMAEKYKTATTDEDKKKYYYLKADITDKEIDDCFNLIKIFGYQIINSPEEADTQLAYLSKNNLVDYIASDDMDILLFGGEILLKKFSTSSKNTVTQEINLYIMKQELGFTQNDLIKLGVLLGSDYCDNSSISINKAYKIIKNIDIDDNEILKYCEQAIQHFKHPKNKKITKITTGKLSEHDLIIFLKKFDYSDDEINKLLLEFFN